MHITAVTEREKKKSAACEVCVSGAFLASAGTLQQLLSEVYNTIINLGQSDKWMSTAKFLQVLTAGKIKEDPLWT